MAVSGGGEPDWLAWFLFCRGLHAYRTGTFAEAISACQESRRRARQGLGDANALTTADLVVEAMALDPTGESRCRTAVA